jgi:AcrR family transcriptional regulator
MLHLFRARLIRHALPSNGKCRPSACRPPGRNSRRRRQCCRRGRHGRRTVYRYFPAKTDLVAALVAAFSASELAALESAAKAAPGPLSALAAAITTLAARALAGRRLAFALIAEPVEPEVDAARASYREALVNEFNRLIRSAHAGGGLPDQDVALAAAALVGALIEGLIGPSAPAAPDDPAKARARVQALTLFALRGLGVVDARARGLVVQTVLPTPGK